MTLFLLSCILDKIHKLKQIFEKHHLFRINSKAILNEEETTYCNTAIYRDA